MNLSQSPKTLRMRIALGNFIAALLILSSIGFATQARVEGMGKRPAFFLDDITMFDNPANATFYSSSLMGELGYYSNSLGDLKPGKNQDPLTPWFGILFHNPLADNGLRNPEITIGGFFGREHLQFTRFVPRKVLTFAGDTVAIPRTVTNFDGFLAGTMIDGSAVGAHVYVGVANGMQDDGVGDKDAHTSILTLDFGTNFLISNESSIEATLSAARIQYGPSRKSFLDPHLFSFYSQGRLFLEMDAWTGQLIPGYKIAKMEVPGWDEKSIDLSLGANVIIPRGLFWFGIDGIMMWEEMSTWDKWGAGTDDEYMIYREPGSREDVKWDTKTKFGGVVSFGIERNIWSSWLILRAGGQKSFVYETCENKTGYAGLCETSKGDDANYWTTNPFSDGTLDDHIGVGIGLNIDDKLKIDASLAEDAFFRNPFQGEGRFISRVSAVYYF